MSTDPNKAQGRLAEIRNARLKKPFDGGSSNALLAAQTRIGKRQRIHPAKTHSTILGHDQPTFGLINRSAVGGFREGVLASPAANAGKTLLPDNAMSQSMRHATTGTVLGAVATQLDQGSLAPVVRLSRQHEELAALVKKPALASAIGLGAAKQRERYDRIAGLVSPGGVLGRAALNWRVNPPAWHRGFANSASPFEKAEGISGANPSRQRFLDAIASAEMAVPAFESSEDLSASESFPGFEPELLRVEKPEVFAAFLQELRNNPDTAREGAWILALQGAGLLLPQKYQVALFLLEMLIWMNAVLYRSGYWHDRDQDFH